MKVQKHDRRDIDKMLKKEHCNHDRRYEGTRGWWYCADCPEFGFEEAYFDGRTDAGAKWPKGANPPTTREKV